MYYLLLGLALAAGAIGFLVRRRSEPGGNAMIIAGVLGCVASVWWQARQTVFAPADQGPDRGQAVVSYFLANAVLKEVGNRQGTVVLLFPPETVFDEDTVGTYAGTFGRVVRGMPNLKMEVRILDVPAKAARAGHIPLAAFQKTMSNGPPGIAYVSFAGVPPGIEKLLPADSVQALHFFAFDPWGTTNWVASLKKGVVRTVIVPRPETRHLAGGEISGEPNEVFHRLYLMATPATADQVGSNLRAN